jgi:hypothetical protein
MRWRPRGRCEEVLTADLFGNAGALQHEVKQSACTRNAKHDSLLGQLSSQCVECVDARNVKHWHRFRIEQKLSRLRVGRADSGVYTFSEVVGIEEDERRFEAIDDQTRNRLATIFYTRCIGLILSVD